MNERPPLPDRIRSRADVDALLAAATNYEERLPRDPLRKALDLGRVRALFAAVGNPHVGPRTLHVAGSKGKGSVARMLGAALRRRGGAPRPGSVGVYTSPHLEDLTERIEIDGEPVSERSLAKAADRLLPHLRRTRGTSDAPTFFEILTAVAWLAFHAAGCRDVVLETGLGGRLDATSVCAPAVTVITTIELEHTRQLGNTLEAIAAEKAGVLKPGVPAVTTATGVAAVTIRDRARAVGAPLLVLDDDFHVRDARSEPGPRTRFLVETADGGIHRGAVPLAGAHHAVNAAAAFLALRTIGMTEEDAWAGLATVRLPGVVEPIGKGPDLIVDGAHTALSALATRQAVAVCWPGRPVVLLTAMLQEKDAAGVARALGRDVTAVVTTQSDTPRAVPAQALADTYRAVVTVPVEAVPAPPRALARARQLAGTRGLVLCSGSVYLAGTVRRHARGVEA